MTQSRPSAGGRLDFGKPISIVVLLVLSAVILVPIGTVVLTSLLSSPIGTSASFTLDNFVSILTDRTSLPLVQNSIVYTLCTALIAIVLAGLFAWVTTTVDLPGRQILRLLPLTILFEPPLLKDPAWIELYNPNTGAVNVVFTQLFHLAQGPFNVYSMAGMIVIAAFNVLPVPYLILLAPLESLDRSFVEASEMSGASRLRTIVRIVVPVLTPAFLSALLLTLIIVASSFETPILIGIPGHIGTYMASIYLAMSSADPDMNIASAQATAYLLLTGFLLTWYLFITRRERRFASVSGRGATGFVARPGPVAWIAVVLLLAHFLITFVMPVGITILVSLLPYFTLSGGAALPPLTLENYVEIVSVQTNLSAVINSIVLSIETVIVSVGAALLLALVALKTRIPGRRWAEVIGTVPIGVPGIVFSVALLVTVVSIPGVRLLYSTPVPLIIAEMVVFLPFALRIISSALIQIQDELLEASQVSGAGRWRTGVRILMPLLLPALLYSCAAVFVMSFRELGAVILLVTANLNLIPSQTFAYWATGNQGQVAALNMISLVVPLIGVVTVLLLVRTRRVSGGRAQGVAPNPALTSLAG